MIAVSVAITVLKALKPWFDAWVEVQRKKGLEKMKTEEGFNNKNTEHEEKAETAKVIKIDDWK